MAPSQVQLAASKRLAQTWYSVSLTERDQTTITFPLRSMESAGRTPLLPGVSVSSFVFVLQLLVAALKRLVKTSNRVALSPHREGVAGVVDRDGRLTRVCYVGRVGELRRLPRPIASREAARATGKRQEPVARNGVAQRWSHAHRLCHTWRASRIVRPDYAPNEAGTVTHVVP